jgi:hypothetical protein
MDDRAAGVPPLHLLPQPQPPRKQQPKPPQSLRARNNFRTARLTQDCALISWPPAKIRSMKRVEEIFFEWKN